jgi:quinol monooxygenase YgiN
MSSNDLVVIATIQAKKGTAAELKAAFLKLVKHSQAEEGCIKYDLHQSIDDEDSFVFFEIWTGEDALHKHATSDFMVAHQKISRELIATSSLKKYHLVSP